MLMKEVALWGQKESVYGPEHHLAYGEQINISTATKWNIIYPLSSAAL